MRRRLDVDEAIWLDECCAAGLIAPPANLVGVMSEFDDHPA
jgi:hypothetical protein